MLVIYALLPLIFILVTMGVFSWPAKKAMPLAALLTAFLAFFVWQMPVDWLLASTIKGALTAIDILLIVFGALLLVAMLQRSKAMDVIIDDFKILTPDNRLQLLIIGWLFVTFLEGIAGFGTAVAIAAPLLVVLGFPVLPAVALPLIMDAVPVTFGAVGVPVTLGVKTAVPDLSQAALQSVAVYSALLHAAVALFLPLVLLGVMTRYFSKEKSWKSGLAVWPFAFVASLSFLIPSVLTAYFIGPELPSIIGSLVGLTISIFFLRMGWCVPKKVWTFSGKVKKNRHHVTFKDSIKAWSPYVVVSILLILTRIEALGIKQILQDITVSYSNILGTGLIYSLPILYSPGFIFVIISLLAGLAFGLSFKNVANTTGGVFKKLVPAMVALVFTIALVNILVNSGTNATGYKSMLLLPAEQLAAAVSVSWFFFSPFIGALGAFISGSNTVSNILFGFFQYSVADQLGLSTILILALQSVGGGIGNMICIHNIVAACTTVGISGQEGKVLRITLLPALIYCVLVGLIGLALVFLL